MLFRVLHGGEGWSFSTEILGDHPDPNRAVHPRLIRTIPKVTLQTLFQYHILCQLLYSTRAWNSCLFSKWEKYRPRVVTALIAFHISDIDKFPQNQLYCPNQKIFEICIKNFNVLCFSAPGVRCFREIAWPPNKRHPFVLPCTRWHLSLVPFCIRLPEHHVYSKPSWRCELGQHHSLA